jgi:chromosome segregation ATPase
MPELYGHPFKYELRAQIREGEQAYEKLYKEHEKTLGRLRYAECKIAALEAKVQRMEQKAREILAEAARDIRDEVSELWDEAWKREREARDREIQAIFAQVESQQIAGA